MLFRYIAGNTIQKAMNSAKILRKHRCIPVFNYAVENTNNSLATYNEYQQ